MAKKEAHHGGAWKVAYADFVTAMMALFMVLWISAQDPKIVIATSQYFKNPFLAAAADATSGVLPFNNKRSAPNDPKDHGTMKDRVSDQTVKLTLLNSVAADFYRLLHLEENVAERPIDIEISGDGLRVTIFDRAHKPMFAENTADLTEWGQFVLQNLAWVIDHHHFRVIIDGHTRASLQFARADYTSWELSTDRALAARRALVHYAVDESQIDRVTGYGATRCLPNTAPDADANQRITLSLNLSTKVAAPPRVADVPVEGRRAATKPTS